MDEERSQVSLQEEKTEQADTSVGGKKTGRPALIIGGIVAGVLVAACAAVCGVAASRNTVLPGTSVLGVDVGGLTPAQIQETWEKEGAKVCDETEIPLLMDGEELRAVPLSSLGVSVRAQDVARDAWDAGHSGNFLANGWRLVRSWFHGTEVEPRFSLDEETLKQFAETLGKELSIAAVDGSYRLDAKEEAGGLYVTKPKDGILIDNEALVRSVKQDVESGELAPVECAYTVLEAKPIDLDEMYEKVHGEMSNAGYDSATGELTEGKVGVDFDVAKAKELLEKAEAGKEFQVPATLTFPAVTKENLKDVLFRDCLGSYTTYVSGSSNRLYNVQRAAGFLSGAVVNSGDVFSFYYVVGGTDKAEGYMPAPGYAGGKTVDMYGGGVCQVSSTLYYATLLSNLEIVTRYCHQYAPAYITWGCDATVSDGSPDYCFRNNTNYPIKIVTWYSGNNLTVSIYGTKLDDTYVSMVSETLSSTPSYTEYKDDPTLPKGSTKVDQTPYTGYHVRTWRYVYAGDGTLISSEWEADSYYDMRPEIILVGTKETPKPDPKPEPKPTPGDEGGGEGGETPAPGEGGGSETPTDPGDEGGGN